MNARSLSRIATEYEPCITCGGEGTVIEFHRFAGEYQAGEPVEVECPECHGTGGGEEPAPRAPYTPSAEYLAWCAEVDAARTTVTHSDPLLGRAAA